MLIYCNATVQYYNFYSIIILQNTFFKIFLKNIPILKKFTIFEIMFKIQKDRRSIENTLKILTNFSNIKIENLFIWVQVVSFSKTGYTTLHKLDKSRNLTPRRVK